MGFGGFVGAALGVAAGAPPLQPQPHGAAVSQHATFWQQHLQQNKFLSRSATGWQQHFSQPHPQAFSQQAGLQQAGLQQAGRSQQAGLQHPHVRSQQAGLQQAGLSC